MGRAPCCDSTNTKKGSWSPEEDAALKNYIQKHGIGGSWIALPRKAGLKRCGKSCRLRWLNYLRPGIKHGGFTEEEDNIICTLYVSMGSRWSLIASQLPGRTDNDVKNYWNTRLKKKLLAGKIAKRSNNGNHDDTRDCNNNNRMATSRANVPNLAEFSVSVPELDCYNTSCSPYLAASSGGLPPLMEVIGYQQHCDQQQLICDQMKFPVLDVTEIPDLGASGFKSCCLSSSQEIPSLSASSSLALENKFVSWSGNGSVVQEDENSLESGSKSFYEILADFDPQGKSSEIASYVDKPDSNPQLIGSLANYYEYIRNAQCFCGCC